MFNKDKRYKKILHSTASLIILGIIFLLLLKALLGAYKKEALSNENLERQRKELSRLIDRKKNLEQSVEYLKTEKGVEAEIRSKFRVAREGESLAIIVGDESTSTLNTENTDIENNDKTATVGFFHKFFYWLGL